jgi:cytochrome c oxidase cbb3-type subunit 3
MMSDKKQGEEEVQVFDDEKSILLDHDYDGIKELNHPLPSWWITIFYLTIAFAAVYYIYYTFLGAQTIEEAYRADISEIEEAKAAYLKEQGGFDLDSYNAYVITEKAMKVGKKTYKRKCKACHGKDGGGGIGPNLADKYWINGNGSVETVYDVIYHGVEEKGMQAWGTTLSDNKMMAVVKYVMDFQGTNPEGPKEAQGELYE